MYSKEFMKFLFSYQKDEFKSKEPEYKEVKFNTPKGGKLAKVYVTESTNK